MRTKTKARSMLAIYLTHIILGIVLSIGVFIANPAEAKAWDAYLTEDGIIEIYTADKKKDPDVPFYRSIGLSITRCEYNPTSKKIHSSGEHQLHAFDGGAFVQSTTESGGKQFNTFAIPLSTVMGGASGDWAKEIQDALDGVGPAVYIKLDCMMVTFNGHSSTPDPGIYTNFPGDGNGEGTSDVGIANGIRIDKRYGWANPRGLLTHFNHYLIIGKGVEIEPVEMDDEFVCHDFTIDNLKHAADLDPEGNQPTFVTDNEATGFKFNLLEGIPSSEYVDNQTIADRWYGNTDVYARTVTKEYNWTIHYFWMEDTSFWTADNQWIEDYEMVGEDVDLDIGIAAAAFQFLSNVHVYDLTDMAVHNGAYEGGVILYQDEPTVPVTLISSFDYEDIGTVREGDPLEEEPDWNADTEKHLEFLEEINYLEEREIGSEAELAAAVYEDTMAIRELISAGTWTKNDKFTVDGNEYLNDEIVYGCDFFEGEPASYRECEKSAGWTFDYMQQGSTLPLNETDPEDAIGETTVQIPSTIDNGKYHTWMQVYFKRTGAYTEQQPPVDLKTGNAPY